MMFFIYENWERSIFRSWCEMKHISEAKYSHETDDDDLIALFSFVCVHRPGINILPVSCFVLLPHTISLQLSFPLFPPPSPLRSLLVLLSIHWKSQSFLISMFRCVCIWFILSLSAAPSQSLFICLSACYQPFNSFIIRWLFFVSRLALNTMCATTVMLTIYKITPFIYTVRAVCVHNKPNRKVWIELSRVFVFAPKIKCLNMNCWLEAVIVIFGTPRPIQ